MSKLTERKNIMILCFSILLLIFFSGSHAQDYPKGTVQLVVPFAPGGAVDIFWRSIVDLLSKNLNGTIAILNKPGGGGVVGTSFVVNSKPDGYTIGGGPTDVLIFAPLFTPNIHFDVISDLTYIAKLAFWPQIVIVRADSPFKTLQDLISFAKANPKKLKAGTPGPGTAPHMALHFLIKMQELRLFLLSLEEPERLCPNFLVDISIWPSWLHHPPNPNSKLGKSVYWPSFHVRDIQFIQIFQHLLKWG